MITGIVGIQKTFCKVGHLARSKIICDIRGRSRSIMNKIEDVTVKPMPDSPFLKPLRVEFTHNGVKRFWDLVKLHESVAVVIFNKSRDVLVLVKQFRPAVFYSAAAAMQSSGRNEIVTNIDWTSIPPELGVTLELCAGICDNPKLSQAEIAKQEVFEECGYDVPIENFQRVTSYRAGVGASGEKLTMFYTEVTDEMKVTAGGGNIQDGEFIEVIEMSIPEIRQYVSQETVPSPGGFLFAINWFLDTKVSK